MVANFRLSRLSSCLANFSLVGAVFPPGSGLVKAV
jgi:hypothetical protein